MGYISEDCIRRVQEANDIVAVVESYNVSLKRTGSTFKALCPFHNEKTPSFNVNPRLQIFKCFGCDVGGDVFKFVRLMERVEFPEAVELLAGRAGIEIEREGGNEPRPQERDTESKKALLWATSKTCAYFEEMLEDINEGRRARDYLIGRGFTQETIQTWRLGWSPDRWDGLVEYLVRQAGEHRRAKTLEVGVRANVLRQKEDGRDPYDAFRGRVMFPIFDTQHRPVGFGGRVFELKPESGGKYINSSEGRLFEKRRLLYGLNFAAKEIGITRTAIIVEGYTDTIMCHQYGLRNVVATLGTSLTREHIQLLRRYIHNDGKVIALFDSDAAGEKATERAIEIFMEEGVPLHVVRSLELKDACEFLPKFGIEAFREQLDKAEDSFSFSLRKIFSDGADDISGKAVAVEKIMSIVNRSPNRVLREMMRREVAMQANIPEDALPKPTQNNRSAPGEKPGRNRGLSPRAAVAEVMSDNIQHGKRAGWEQKLLRYMLARREWCNKVADICPPDEFTDEACAKLAALIRDAWEESETAPDPATLVRDSAGADRDGLLADLMMDESGPGLTVAELDGIIERIKLERLKQEEKELAEDYGDGAESEDEFLLRKVQMQKLLKIRQEGGSSEK